MPINPPKINTKEKGFDQRVTSFQGWPIYTHLIQKMYLYQGEVNFILGFALPGISQHWILSVHPRVCGEKNKLDLGGT